MEKEFRTDHGLTVSVNIHENCIYKLCVQQSIVFMNVYRDGQPVVRSKFCFHAMIPAVVGLSLHLS
jgi:hypothetical protein